MDVRIIVKWMESRETKSDYHVCSVTFYEDVNRNRVILTFKSREQIRELIDHLQQYEEEVPSYGKPMEGPSEKR